MSYLGRRAFIAGCVSSLFAGMSPANTPTVVPDLLYPPPDFRAEPAWGEIFEMVKAAWSAAFGSDIYPGSANYNLCEILADGAYVQIKDLELVVSSAAPTGATPSELLDILYGEER